MARVSEKTPEQARRAARRAAARRARGALELLVADPGERELYTEAVERYVAAVELAAGLRQEWENLGGPMLAEGSMRQPIPHPLIKMIADAEAAAARYAISIGLDPAAKRRGQSRGGRPVGAVSAPDRAAKAAPARPSAERRALQLVHKA